MKELLIFYMKKLKGTVDYLSIISIEQIKTDGETDIERKKTVFFFLNLT